MKLNVKGYIVKISFQGDSITPIYRFRLYRPNKRWFSKFLWEEIVHREDIISDLATSLKVISNYENNLLRWKNTK